MATMTAPSPSIEARRLSKSYRGRPVVRDLHFAVAAGEVYALVGPNGAGKTTVLRLVSGLAFPTSGEVRLLGRDPHKAPEVRRSLGGVVEAPAAFYPYLTGRKNLQLHARLAGAVTFDRIEEVLDLVELGAAANRPVKVYSLGMRQRLGLAAALLTEPQVLILDEPASGMDPLSLELVHRVLRDSAAAGAAVLLSTHHLQEVVRYCSRVGIMEEGRLVDEVDLSARGHCYRARVARPHEARVLLETQSFVLEAGLRRHDLTFVLRDDSHLPQVVRLLSDAGIGLLELGEDTFDLRSYYQERVRERGSQRSTESPRDSLPAQAEGGIR